MLYTVTTTILCSSLIIFAVFQVFIQEQPEVKYLTNLSLAEIKGKKRDNEPKMPLLIGFLFM